MPQIQILHIGAVLQGLGVLRGQHPAHGGLGGQNPLHIGADAVVLAEPDTPDHLHIGELVPDGGHLLIAEAAAVHVQGFQAGHAPQGQTNLGAAVLNGDVFQVNAAVAQPDGLPVKLSGVAEVQVGEGLHNGGHILPAEVVPGRTQVYGCELGQAGGSPDQLLHAVMGESGHVQSADVIGDGVAVGQGHVVADGDLRVGLGPGVDFLITFAAPQVRHQQPLELVQLADLVGSDHHGDALGVLRNGTGGEVLFGGNRRPRQLLTARQDQGRRQRRYHNCDKKFLMHGSNLAYSPYTSLPNFPAYSAGAGSPHLGSSQ